MSLYFAQSNGKAKVAEKVIQEQLRNLSDHRLTFTWGSPASTVPRPMHDGQSHLVTNNFVYGMMPKD